MSYEYDKQIEEIEKSREKIAYAVAMAVCDGKKENVAKYYRNFLDILTNDTEYFFVKSKDIIKTYEKKVLSSLKEISGFLDKDLSSNIFNIQNTGGVSPADVVGEKVEKSECEKLYEKRKKIYGKITIRYNSFKKLYDSKGLDGILKLDSLVKKANNILFMEKAKKFLSNMREVAVLPNIHKKFGKLSRGYGLKTLDDLMVLNTEIDSFFVDEKNLNDDIKKIVEENRQNFRKRIGAKEDYFIAEKEARKLKKEISRVYNYNLYREVFGKTNIIEFFSKYGYELNEHNLKETFCLLFGSFKVTGICSKRNFGRGDKQCIFLSSEITSSEWLQESKNDLILHESIHAMEKTKENYKNSFCFKYRSINEAMTEFLARESLKYLDNNILSEGVEKRFNQSLYSIYDPMLPLVKKLFESDFKEDFLKAKFEGDVVGLEHKIGMGNLKKISKCLIDAFEYGKNEKIINMALLELDNILENVQKKAR